MPDINKCLCLKTFRSTKQPLQVRIDLKLPMQHPKLSPWRELKQSAACASIKNSIALSLLDSAAKVAPSLVSLKCVAGVNATSGLSKLKMTWNYVNAHGCVIPTPTAIRPAQPQVAWHPSFRNRPARSVYQAALLSYGRQSSTANRSDLASLGLRERKQVRSQTPYTVLYLYLSILCKRGRLPVSVGSETVVSLSVGGT